MTLEEAIRYFEDEVNTLRIIEQRHRRWCDARKACELALAALREKQERDG